MDKWFISNKMTRLLPLTLFLFSLQCSAQTDTVKVPLHIIDSILFDLQKKDSLTILVDYQADQINGLIQLVDLKDSTISLHFQLENKLDSMLMDCDKQRGLSDKVIAIKQKEFRRMRRERNGAIIGILLLTWLELKQ